MARKTPDRKKIEEALNFAFSYGQIDGDHHKAWVIDQMVRVLIGNKEDYEKQIKEYKDQDGPDTYTWEEGIAP